MSKRKILMSLAATFLLSTAAMAEGPKAGGVVNAVIQPEPPSLMVGLVQNGPTQMVAGNIYEGLLRYSPKLEPLPGLAESWNISEDGKVYAFKLMHNLERSCRAQLALQSSGAEVIELSAAVAHKTAGQYASFYDAIETNGVPDSEWAAFKRMLERTDPDFAN